MDNLRVSTMTAISELNTDINLDNLYKNIQINNLVPYIQHGAYGAKGSSEKNKRKVRKPEKKKVFFNQVTMHVNCDKLVNVKLFNNGKIQMTGLKYENHGNKVLENILPYISKLDDDSEPVNKIFNTEEPIAFKPTTTVLINSDFDIKYKIDRSVLHREIIDNGTYSSYEPCIYPGVNIKYFFNTNQSNGICCCNALCNGKGCADGDGLCKKITIAVFKSGKIIITGAKDTNQLVIAYNFITNFINSKREYIELKE